MKYLIITTSLIIVSATAFGQTKTRLTSDTVKKQIPAQSDSIRVSTKDLQALLSSYYQLVERNAIAEKAKVDVDAANMKGFLANYYNQLFPVDSTKSAKKE